jgi:hypothetical protein
VRAGRAACQGGSRGCDASILGLAREDSHRRGASTAAEQKGVPVLGQWRGGGQSLSRRRAAPGWSDAHRRGGWAGSRPKRAGVAEASTAGEEEGIGFRAVGAAA